MPQQVHRHWSPFRYSQYTYRTSGSRSDKVKVKTKTTRSGKLVMETMTAPHPCCPNTKSVCCLMVLLNLGLLLITLGFVVVLQLYDPAFVWLVVTLCVTHSLSAQVTQCFDMTCACFLSFYNFPSTVFLFRSGHFLAHIHNPDYLQLFRNPFSSTVANIHEVYCLCQGHLFCLSSSIHSSLPHLLALLSSP